MVVVVVAVVCTKSTLVYYHIARYNCLAQTVTLLHNTSSSTFNKLRKRFHYIPNISLFELMPLND